MTLTDDPLDAPGSSRSAAHGTAVRIASYAVSLLISLVSIRLLATHLGDGFGTLSVVSSIAFVAVASTDGGLASLALRRGATLGESDRVHLLENVVGLRIGLCAIGILVAYLFALVTHRGQSFSTGVAIVGAGLTLTMLQGSVATYLQLRLRNVAVAMLELLRAVTLTATYAALVLADSGLTSFYWAPAVSGLAMLAATVAFVPRSLFRPRFDRLTWSRLIRELIPYSLAAATAILYFRVAQIAMEYLSTAAETRQYALAFRVVEVLTVFPALVITSALPLLSRCAAQGPVRLRPFAAGLGSTALLAGLALALATAAGAPIAIEVINGASDPTAVETLRLLAISVAFTFPLITWSFLLISIDRYRAVAACGVATVILAVVLSIVVIPRFGAVGGAAVSVSAETVLASALLVVIARADRHLLPPAGRFGRALAAAGIAAAVILLTRGEGLVLPLLSLPTFACFALAFRAIPPELIDIVRRRAT